MLSSLSIVILTYTSAKSTIKLEYFSPAILTDCFHNATPVYLGCDITQRPYDVGPIFPGLAGRYGSRFQTVTEATAGSTRRIEVQIVRLWSSGLAPDRSSLHRQDTDLSQPNARSVTPKQLCSPHHHYILYIVHCQ